MLRSLILTAALLFPQAASAALPDAALRSRFTSTDKPLVIVVGAKWCKYCPRAAAAVTNVVTKKFAGKVVVVKLDYDADRAFIVLLPQVKTLPEVFVYPFEQPSWKLGSAAAQSERDVEAAIGRALVE